jgi:hypothetical protein
MSNKQHNTPCGMDPEIVLEHSNILACIPEMKNDITLIRKKLIDGNGEKSLITKHEILSEKFENHAKMHTQSKNNTKWIVGILITMFLALIANAITLLTTIDTSDTSNKITKIEQQEVQNRKLLNEITKTIKKSNIRE